MPNIASSNWPSGVEFTLMPTQHNKTHCYWRVSRNLQPWHTQMLMLKLFLHELSSIAVLLVQIVSCQFNTVFLIHRVVVKAVYLSFFCLWFRLTNVSHVIQVLLSNMLFLLHFSCCCCCCLVMSSACVSFILIKMSSISYPVTVQ